MEPEIKHKPLSKKRLYGAFAGYAVLGAIALAVLEGGFLAVILILFGGLALKSWVAYKRETLS